MKFTILKLPSNAEFCLEIFSNVTVCHELLTLIDPFYSQKIVTVPLPRLMFADYQHSRHRGPSGTGLSLGREMKIR